METHEKRPSTMKKHKYGNSENRTEWKTQKMHKQMRGTNYEHTMKSYDKLRKTWEMKDELQKTLKTYEKLLKDTTSNEHPIMGSP